MSYLISDIYYKEKKVIVLNENIANNESYIPNIEKIKLELSVELKHSLKDSIIKMINWNKKYEKNSI